MTVSLPLLLKSACRKQAQAGRDHLFLMEMRDRDRGTQTTKREREVAQFIHDPDEQSSFKFCWCNARLRWIMWVSANICYIYTYSSSHWPWYPFASSRNLFSSKMEPVYSPCQHFGQASNRLSLQRSVIFSYATDCVPTLIGPRYHAPVQTITHELSIGVHR